MEFPDYLLNTAKKRRYLQALERLPSVIAQMGAHEGIRIRDYLLSVRMYTHGGLQLSLDHFGLDKKELLAHVEQAEAQGREICVEGKNNHNSKESAWRGGRIAVYAPTKNRTKHRMSIRGRFSD